MSRRIVTASTATDKTSAANSVTAVTAKPKPSSLPPWKYDSFLVPAGTLTVDARHPLPLDAKNEPVLPHAFRPITVRGVTFKNRFVVSPMCQYSCQDGEMNDWHVMHYGKFAAAAASLIIMEMTAVSPNGRITPFCSGLWRDDQIHPLKRIVDFIHFQNAKVGVQLAHAGRKASQLPPFMIKRGGPINAGPEIGGWPNDVVGPSPHAWDKGWLTPKELSVADIKQLVADFVAAAVRAEKAGFDVIELHGAHGYLINAFFSPISNTRTDEYGGSFENRIRFLLEVVTAVRRVWTKPLFVRLSCTEWMEWNATGGDAASGGWDMKQTEELASRLLALGVDVIDCSSGGNSAGQKVKTGPCYQVPFSARLKQLHPSMVTAAVGEITTPTQCEDIVLNDKADFVFIARQLLRDPHFVLNAAKELKVPIAFAPQYQRAKL